MPLLGLTIHLLTLREVDWYHPQLHQKGISSFHALLEFLPQVPDQTVVGQMKRSPLVDHLCFEVQIDFTKVWVIPELKLGSPQIIFHHSF